MTCAGKLYIQMQYRSGVSLSTPPLLYIIKGFNKCNKHGTKITYIHIIKYTPTHNIQVVDRMLLLLKCIMPFFILWTL